MPKKATASENPGLSFQGKVRLGAKRRMLEPRKGALSSPQLPQRHERVLGANEQSKHVALHLLMDQANLANHLTSHLIKGSYSVICSNSWKTLFKTIAMEIPFVAQQLMNPTRILEGSALIPGLPQGVKDLALP